MPRAPEFFVVTDDTPGRSLAIENMVVGDTVEQCFVFSRSARDAFRVVANDRAPVHDDERFARSKGFGGSIVQGFCVATRFSRLLGMYLPGEFAILEQVALRFRQPTYEGQMMRYRARLTRVLYPMKVVRLKLIASSEDGDHLDGEAQCLIR